MDGTGKTRIVCLDFWGLFLLVDHEFISGCILSFLSFLSFFLFNCLSIIDLSVISLSSRGSSLNFGCIFLLDDYWLHSGSCLFSGGVVGGVGHGLNRDIFCDLGGDISSDLLDSLNSGLDSWLNYLLDGGINSCLNDRLDILSRGPGFKRRGWGLNSWRRLLRCFNGRSSFLLHFSLRLSDCLEFCRPWCQVCCSDGRCFILRENVGDEAKI